MSKEKSIFDGSKFKSGKGTDLSKGLSLPPPPKPETKAIDSGKPGTGLTRFTGGSSLSSTDKSLAEVDKEKYQVRATTERSVDQSGVLRIAIGHDATASMESDIRATQNAIESIMREIREMVGVGTKVLYQIFVYTDYRCENQVIRKSELTDDVKSLVGFMSDISEDPKSQDWPEAVAEVYRAIRDQGGEPFDLIFILGDSPDHDRYDDIPTAMEEAGQFYEEFGTQTHTLVVRDSGDTIHNFRIIAEFGHGVTGMLDNREEVMKMIVLPVAQRVGGEKGVEETLARFKASAGTVSKELAAMASSLKQLPPPPNSIQKK